MTPAMGQLASAGLGHFPDDPLRCGLNSSKPHTDASATRRSSPNSSWNKHGVAFLLLGFLTFYSEKFPGLPSCGRCATVGWVGAQFFQLFAHDRRCFMQPAVLKPLHSNLSVSGRTACRGSFCCFRPSVDSLSCMWWGSMLLLVRESAL